MTVHRRRLDIVLEPDYVGALFADSLEELGEKRRLVDELENELSYYRRLLHGRLDLLRYELARRRGEETRSLIDALPDLLAGDLTGAGPGHGNPLGRLRGEFTPAFPEVERRFNRITDNDFLTRLPELTDADLEGIQSEFESMEEEISNTRGRLHEVHDAIVAELAARYQAADSG